eukprot:m.252692 g.252692  ORF g.252692 m.252692 type:complete len:640 (-) comp16156_c0_seq9:2639-4558(-)
METTKPSWLRQRQDLLTGLNEFNNAKRRRSKRKSEELQDKAPSIQPAWVREDGVVGEQQQKLRAVIKVNESAVGKKEADTQVKPKTVLLRCPMSQCLREHHLVQGSMHNRLGKADSIARENMNDGSNSEECFDNESVGDIDDEDDLSSIDSFMGVEVDTRAYRLAAVLSLAYVSSKEDKPVEKSKKVKSLKRKNRISEGTNNEFFFDSETVLPPLSHYSHHLPLWEAIIDQGGSPCDLLTTLPAGQYRKAALGDMDTFYNAFVQAGIFLPEDGNYENGRDIHKLDEGKVVDRATFRSFCLFVEECAMEDHNGELYISPVAHLIRPAFQPNSKYNCEIVLRGKDDQQEVALRTTSKCQHADVLTVTCSTGWLDNGASLCSYGLCDPDPWILTTCILLGALKENMIPTPEDTQLTSRKLKFLNDRGFLASVEDSFAFILSTSKHKEKNIQGSDYAEELDIAPGWPELSHTVLSVSEVLTMTAQELNAFECENPIGGELFEEGDDEMEETATPVEQEQTDSSLKSTDGLPQDQVASDDESVPDLVPALPIFSCYSQDVCIPGPLSREERLKIQLKSLEKLLFIFVAKQKRADYMLELLRLEQGSLNQWKKDICIKLWEEEKEAAALFEQKCNFEIICIKNAK